VFELMVDQVECADVLVLNKCDLAAGGAGGGGGNLRALNPWAEFCARKRGRWRANGCWPGAV